MAGIFKKEAKKMTLPLDYRDCIVQLLSEGCSREFVFTQIEKNYMFKAWNKSVRQELADTIAQVECLDVYAASDK